MSYSGPAGGTKFQVVTYVGDGTTNRVIVLSFTPRIVIIMEATDATLHSEEWKGDNGQGFVKYQSGGTNAVVGRVAEPNSFPLLVNGFNVGKAHFFNVQANINLLNYILIALG